MELDKHFPKMTTLQLGHRPFFLTNIYGRPFQEKMCVCATNRTPNQDLHVLQVCCYSLVLI